MKTTQMQYDVLHYVDRGTYPHGREEPSRQQYAYFYRSLVDLGFMGENEDGSAFITNEGAIEIDDWEDYLEGRIGSDERGRNVLIMLAVSATVGLGFWIWVAKWLFQ